jgi:cold shock CspA family protein
VIVDAELSMFLSYSHADKAIAQQLASRLRQRGVRVWIDEGELRIGDSIIERISTALADVHFVLAIVSAASVASPWCNKELSLAMTGGLKRKGVKVLPLRLGDAEMPVSLMDCLYLQVDPSDLSTAVERLIHDAQAHYHETVVAIAEAAELPTTLRQPSMPNPEVAAREKIESMIANETYARITSRSRHRGRVKWFNAEKGYGFVSGEDGQDYFVHFSWIIADGYRALTEGEEVMFTAGQAGKGPAAIAIVQLRP